MMNISVCLIVKNEENNIARCLQSVKHIAKEIIVVDTGSTDDTVNIAKKTGAKVFHYQWENNFANARNYALEQAGGNWIMFLDADEYIVAGAAGEELTGFIAKIHGNRKIDGIACVIENTEGVDGSLKSTDRIVRIFRNSRSVRYKGRIHECVYKNDGLLMSVIAAKEAIYIRHSGYTNANVIEKIKRNLLLLEEDISQGDIGNLTYYYLCHSYLVLEQYEQAINYAHKALEHGVISTTTVAHKPYVVLIQSLLQLYECNQDDVRVIVDAALEKYPRHPEILKCLGDYCQKSGRFSLALTAYLEAIKAQDCFNDTNLANDFFMELSQVHANIAAIYEKMNNHIKCLDHYMLALKYDKGNQLAFDGLILVVRGQKNGEIVYFLNSLYDIHAEPDIGFLVKRLSALKVTRVFAYYEQIWTEQFHHPEYIDMNFFLRRQFDQAYQFFAAYFCQSGDYGAELLAVVSALLGGNPAWIEPMLEKMNGSLAKIVKAYFSPDENDLLTPAELPYFTDLVLNFCHFSDDRQMNKLLNIGLISWPGYITVNIAGTLVKQGLYVFALNLYLHCLLKTDLKAGLAKDVFCLAGFCCYKLRDFQQAVEFFEKGLQAGYAANDISEYLAWVYTQCDDAGVHQKIEYLRTIYHPEPLFQA